MAFAKLPNVPGPHHRPFGRLLAMEQTNQDIPHDVDDCDVLDVLSSPFVQPCAQWMMTLAVVFTTFGAWAAGTSKDGGGRRLAFVRRNGLILIAVNWSGGGEVEALEAIWFYCQSQPVFPDLIKYQVHSSTTYLYTVITRFGYMYMYNMYIYIHMYVQYSMSWFRAFLHIIYTVK